jgi:hypothetical protein
VSPVAIIWAPVQITRPEASARINDCGPGRVHHCEPGVRLVRAATGSRAGDSDITSFVHVCVSSEVFDEQ